MKNNTENNIERNQEDFLITEPNYADAEETFFFDKEPQTEDALETKTLKQRRAETRAWLKSKTIKRNLRRGDIKKNPKCLFFTKELDRIRDDVDNNLFSNINLYEPYIRLNKVLAPTQDSALEFAKMYYHYPLGQTLEVWRKDRKRFKLLFPNMFAEYDQTAQDFSLKLITPSGRSIVFKAEYKVPNLNWYKSDISAKRRRNIQAFRPTFFYGSLAAVEQRAVVVPAKLTRKGRLLEVRRYKIARTINAKMYKRGARKDRAKQVRAVLKERFWKLVRRIHRKATRKRNIIKGLGRRRRRVLVKEVYKQIIRISTL